MQASDRPLEHYHHQTLFDPISTLQLANARLAETPDSAAAHLLAFMSHAELFGRRHQSQNKNAAEEHYKRAITLDPSLALFPNRYQFQELIGVGGFSYVFKVDTGGTPQALKLIKPSISLGGDSWLQLASVLGALSKVDSAGIGKLISVSQEPGPPFYYTLEYGPSASLRDWIALNTPSDLTSLPQRGIDFYRTVVEIALRAALALKAAYDNGVLHLDLKPENILIAPYDDPPTITIIDFNLLTIQRAALSSLSLGVFQSSIKYLAPEVLSNVSLATDRSDIYSLALVIIEMLGGTVDPGGTFDILTRLANDEPRLGVLLIRCLHNSPSGRPEHWAAVIDALKSIREELLERIHTINSIRPKLDRLKQLLLPDVSDLAIFLTHLMRGKHWRQAEIGLGFIVPLFLTGHLVRQLITAIQTFGVRTAFLPCLFAALSFTWLSFYYFIRLSCRVQYYNYSIGVATRFIVAWAYLFPVLWGATHYNLWPIGAAFGVLLVAINNLLILKYLTRVPSPSGAVFTGNREFLTVALRGYAVSAFFYSGSLAISGCFLEAIEKSYPHDLLPFLFNCVLAGACVAVNVMLQFTKVSAGSAGKIVRGVALETALRGKWGHMPLSESANIACRNNPVIMEIKRWAEMLRRGQSLAGLPTKVGLVIEGGGMRGVYSGGVLVALESLGLKDVFDEVHAESAGAINACYFLASQTEFGASIYLDDLSRPEFINFLRIRRVLDMDYLDWVMSEPKRLNVDAVRNSRTRLFVSLTDASNGQTRRIDVSKENLDLRVVLKATAAIVPLYNSAVELDGARYVDGGIANPVPVRDAIDSGCTHILVLLTRGTRYTPRGFNRLERFCVDRLLKGWSERFVEVFYSVRWRRYNEARQIAFGTNVVDANVKMAVICPDEMTPRVSRLTRRRSELVAGMESMRVKTLQIFE
ncbi:MAG: patatin-like phospholipase family protein [Bryobacteraceae bacterium]|jgi:predicted patatin/cPLA2 family phospholipase/serine/threonine protein kinase